MEDELILNDIFSGGVVTREEFEIAKGIYSAKGIKSNKDIIWALFNRKLVSCIKENNWQEMRLIYYEMAIFECKEGKEFFHLLQESRKCDLMNYRSLGIKSVEIKTAGKENSCETCQKLEGKRMTIEDALQTMPIPVKECQKDAFDNGKGFCRCCYLAIWDDILTIGDEKIR